MKVPGLILHTVLVHNGPTTQLNSRTTEWRFLGGKTVHSDLVKARVTFSLIRPSSATTWQKVLLICAARRNTNSNTPLPWKSSSLVKSAKREPLRMAPRFQRIPAGKTFFKLLTCARDVVCGLSSTVDMRPFLSVCTGRKIILLPSHSFTEIADRETTRNPRCTRCVYLMDILL